MIRNVDVSGKTFQFPISIDGTRAVGDVTIRVSRIDPSLSPSLFFLCSCHSYTCINPLKAVEFFFLCPAIYDAVQHSHELGHKCYDEDQEPWAFHDLAHQRTGSSEDFRAQIVVLLHPTCQCR